MYWIYPESMGGGGFPCILVYHSGLSLQLLPQQSLGLWPTRATIEATPFFVAFWGDILGLTGLLNWVTTVPNKACALSPYCLFWDKAYGVWYKACPVLWIRHALIVKKNSINMLHSLCYVSTVGHGGCCHLGLCSVSLHWVMWRASILVRNQVLIIASKMSRCYP